MHCECDAAVAAARFCARARHPGHLDAQRNLADVEREFAEYQRQGPLHAGRVVTVQTSTPVEADAFARILGDVQTRA